MSTVHVVGPAAVSDPWRPSGGNTYHRMVCAGLAQLGWTVHERLVDDAARPGQESVLRGSLAGTLDAIPDGEVVLLDGLVTATAAPVVAEHAERLSLALVVHLPHGLDGAGVAGAGRRAAEQSVLDAAQVVVATSEWTRDWLVRTYAVEPSRVHVASPGVTPAEPAAPSGGGHRLLCVGAVTPTKGQDILVEALAAVADLAWSCRCVGSMDIEPDFAERVAARGRTLGLGTRLTFTGAQRSDAVAAEYAVADLLVVASRGETYGMVVTEALGRAVPVLAGAVGGIPEAMGALSDGRRPGLLVTAGDPASFARALRDWLSDDALREDLRSAAAARRVTLRDWSDTTRRISAALTGAAA
ncbi:MAG: glycosyltransferase family 4 protein [Dermatophilaceae bacterium]